MKGEPSAWVYNWATIFLEDIKNGDLALQVAGVSNLRLGPENDCAGEAQ
jgi:hypothetical protein